MKLVIQTICVLTVTFLVIFFIFSTGRVELLPVTQEETAAAHNLLRLSLTNPRHTHVDFLRENHNIRGTTPYFTDNVRLDTTLDGEAATVFEITVPAAGLYNFSLSYEIYGVSYTPVTVALSINGKIQHEEAVSILLPVFWEDVSKDFPINRFGNQIAPARQRLEGIQNAKLFNTTRISDHPLLFYLEAGTNSLEIHNNTSRTINLYNIGIYSEHVLPEYVNPGNVPVMDLITVNAIDYTYINSPWVRLNTVNNAAHTPYHPVDTLINIVMMRRVGDEVFFSVEIPEDGYYPISIHARPHQISTETSNSHGDLPVFVTFRVNGEIPFAEAASYVIPSFSGQRWRNHTLTDVNGDPLLFYLTKGTHELSIRTELAPIAEHINSLKLMIDHINYLSIEIRRIAGQNIDTNRTWRFTRYIPETVSYLEAYSTVLRNIIFDLERYNPGGRHTAAASSLVQAVALIDRLLEKPDELPVRANILYGAGSSVLQMAGVALDSLLAVNINISSIYLGDVNSLPRPTATFAQSLSSSMRHLWATFTSDKYSVTGADDALNVWAATSTVLHIDTLQRLADTYFTPQTGIPVDIKLMPNQDRLILSNAAGTNPDVGLGLIVDRPFELASRGALLNLTQFDDFWELMDMMAPGTIVGQVFNEGVFAVPETLDFLALIYRTDVLERMNLEVPQTWADVVLMQSELQRFGMSFFHNIATGPGMKYFYQTASFVYQYGGEFFSEDGLTTAIDSPEAIEALTFLADLFSTFALPVEIPVFFNSFRFGQTPIGLADFNTYVLMTESAPELSGLWELALYPGRIQPDGTIDRSFIAGGTACVIFENTDMADEAWEFLKWYMSSETQIRYANELMSNFNILWRSTNMDAIAELPVEDRHRQVFLESMDWVRELPRSPGRYMLERRMSDMWNTMVFEGTPPRLAIDMRIVDINREFNRKIVEFGYFDTEGNSLRPYAVRELDWVREQLRNNRR